jgi:recombination protein RecT
MTDTKKVEKTAAVDVVKKQKDITDSVLDRVTQLQEMGELKLPSDYNVGNALKSAFLVLQETKTGKSHGYKPALEVCTKNSVSQSLLKMVLEGLSVYKKQGYFIVYNNELQWQRSYQGSRALAKRVANVNDVIANVVYEEDVFEYEIDTDTGRKKVVRHEQKIQNINNAKIIGGYAVILHDNFKDLEVMTMEEIEQSWRQGQGRGDVHNKFTQEMVKKTLINRACKGLINSSNDGYLEDNDAPTNTKFDTQQSQVDTEIEEEMAEEVIDFTEVEDVGSDEAPVQQQMDAGF